MDAAVAMDARGPSTAAAAGGIAASGGGGGGGGGGAGGECSVTLRFHVSLDDGPVVSLRRLLQQHQQAQPPAAAPPAGAHPALEARLAPQQEGAQAPPLGNADALPIPANRFSSVIERIERLYKGRESDEEAGGDLADEAGSDRYDTDDSFIDDQDLDEYFAAGQGKAKHTGFFVNKGALERMDVPSISAVEVERPKKRKPKLKRLPTLPGDKADKEHGVDGGKKVGAKSGKGLGRGAPGVPRKKRQKLLPTVEGSLDGHKSNIVESIKDRTEFEPAQLSRSSGQLEVTSQSSAEATHSLSNVNSGQPLPADELSNRVVGSSQPTISPRRKEGVASITRVREDAEGASRGSPEKTFRNGVAAEEQGGGGEAFRTPRGVASSLFVGQEGAKLKGGSGGGWKNREQVIEEGLPKRLKLETPDSGKGRMKGGSVAKLEKALAQAPQPVIAAGRKLHNKLLEKAIVDLQALVPAGQPIGGDESTHLETESGGSQPSARMPRITPEVKAKLGRIVRLAAREGSVVPPDVVDRLKDIMKPMMQPVILKKHLKSMVEKGQTAREAREQLLEVGKKGLKELVAARMENVKGGVAASLGAAGGGAASSKEGGGGSQSFQWDAGLEDHLCLVYERYVEDLDDDRKPFQLRKLYKELAGLWPEGWMDNAGIREAIARAKRKKAKPTRKRQKANGGAAESSGGGAQGAQNAAAGKASNRA